eukprot:RCo028329
MGELVDFGLQLGVGHAELPFGLTEGLDLRSDKLGDVVVGMHRAYPGARPGPVAAGLPSARRVEVFHLQVWEQQLTGLLVDVVLIVVTEVLQLLQAVRASHQGHPGDLPAVPNHGLAPDHLRAYRGQREVQQDAYPVKDPLHDLRWLLHRLQGLHVGLGDRVQGFAGLFKGRLCCREVFLGLFLSSRHLRVLLRQHVLNCTDLVLLLLRAPFAVRDLPQENVSLLDRLAELPLLLIQGLSHLPHVLSSLLELLEAPVDLVSQSADGLILLLVNLHVGVDEREVGLGRGVNVPTEPLEVALALLGHH